MSTFEDGFPLLNALGKVDNDAGFFTWDIPENILYADSALAFLFGLNPLEAEQGLPLNDYLDRVHPEDRPGLAKAIRDSIVSHQIQHEIYRVRNSEDEFVTVASFARGFRDRTGNPIRYVGIVIPAEAVREEEPSSH